VNTALAVKAVVDATEELHKAEQTYQEIKKLYEEGRASKEALDDAKEDVAMASANLAIQTAAATMAAIGATGSASNSMGTGMQADVGLSASINKSEFDATQITQAGSGLWSGGNITLTAKNDIKQEGSG
jgi:multidrug resistance efflux pump